MSCVAPTAPTALDGLSRVPNLCESSLPVLPFGVPEGTPVEAAPLWVLVVELLPSKDAESEFYTLKEIAPLLGRVTPAQLSSHAQDLWPRWEGYYRLNYSQAVSLIRRYCLVGRRLHARADLEARVRQMREGRRNREQAARLQGLVEQVRANRHSLTHGTEIYQ